MATAFQSGSSGAFDTRAYDEERLAKDSLAREAMKDEYNAVAAAPAEGAAAPGAWKWAIRKKMWDYMEENNIARYPRPVHHRIPNFVDCDAAAQRLATLPEFINAKCVKVNPDTPQKMVRFLVLSAGKTLITPQPRLRTGFFSQLTLADLPNPGCLNEACTSAGVAKYGKPLSLDSKIKVDLIVVGSSAVSSTHGGRLGKGEGFAELEYGMLRWMNAIDDKTPVVTTIHDCQVLPEGPDDFDAALLLEHDVPVDTIITPTQVVRISSSIVKPAGILWHRLSPQKLASIRVLQQLKQRIEAKTGQRLPSGPAEQLPPLASRENRGKPPPRGPPRKPSAAKQ